MVYEFKLMDKKELQQLDQILTLEINKIDGCEYVREEYSFIKNKTIIRMINFEELLLINELQSLDKHRFFSLNDKQILFDQNKKIVHDITVSHCNNCNNIFEIDYLEVDHIIPWSLGGKTSLDNAQLLCKSCNAKKSNKI